MALLGVLPGNESTEFKEGDEVTISEYAKSVSGMHFTSQMQEYLGKTTKVTGTWGGNVYLEIDSGRWVWDPSWLKINRKSISSMSTLKEKFAQLFLEEPEKSFRKAGITDGDGVLTDDGEELFIAWLLKKNGDAFKAEVVDPILAADEKK